MSKFDELYNTLVEAVPVQQNTAQPAAAQPVTNQPGTYNQQQAKPATTPTQPAQPAVKPTVNPANVKSVDDLVKSFNDPSAKIDTATLQAAIQNIAKSTPAK